MLIITDAHNGADFAVYGPSGSTWTQNGQVYTSTLNGKNYWSMAFLPQGASSVTAVANEYKKYAYVFPTGTEANWQFDEGASVMRTEFEVFTEIKEGTDSTVLMGLLPHQWAHLASDSPTPDRHSYASVRGELKTMAGNRFAVEHSFHGILPTLPYLDYYSPTFNPAELNQKVNAIKNDQLATWTDSYNEGQVMNRLIQTARIAEMMGDTTALNAIIPTIQERLEDWLSAESNEVAFLFYYQQPWSALLGYPAGHGQDNNINDHHFHWGYFIHAAAFMEQYRPGWAGQWGPMIDLLVRDAASADRNDPQFPYLRNFSPYAGHCWANGFASFPQGNDQESTSESMQFNSALIHWGSITNNDSIRDLGIYLYTTEQAAIEEYWFDQHERIFGPNQTYGLVSRVWGNSYDNGTFWTSDIAASYGIELYPIHGGSLYLGHDSSYVDKIWREIEQYTGILANEVNPNLWHDVMWKYLAFIDPDKAISMYDGYPDRELKFGVSDAQTYHWLHAMQVLGRVEVGLTANHPLAAAFRKGGEIIYVAHNYGDSPIQVTFSDGYQLAVGPRSLATSKDLAVRGSLSSSFSSAYPGGSVTLTATLNGGTATKVEFLNGETLLGEVLQAPYTFQADDLSVGTQTFYARIYEGNDFNISNFVEVLVGEQLPYFGEPSAIPGVIEAAHFDFFEGGKGQGISYQDVSAGNNGDFRSGEDVDAVELANEGATVGWISAGEWLEYTVDVQQAGEYKLDLRYASGNQAGGGPLRIESDGEVISSGNTFTYTGDWDEWRTKSISAVPLKSGRQVLRVYF
ncbi:MAG: glycosyl hydrolase, partial [Bacteroidota bacterium]